MMKLLAIGTMIAFVSAPCGVLSAAPMQVRAQAAANGGDEASRYAAEAMKFAQKADAYATAAKQYLEAGKPIETAQAKRCAELSDMYRQLAVHIRDLAKKARRVSGQAGPPSLSA